MDNLKEFIQEEIMNIAFKKVSFDESLRLFNPKYWTPLLLLI